MPCTKKNWDMIWTPHIPAIVHLTLVCLPWIINMFWNPHANVIPKHNIMQQKKNQCTTYHNAQSSYGASSTMKHDGFQCGICENSFACRALNPFHQVFTCLLIHDNPSNWHPCAMKKTPSMWIGGTSHRWWQMWHLIYNYNMCVCLSVHLTTVPRFNWCGGTGPDSRIRKTGFGPDSRIRKTGFGKMGGQTGQGGAGGRAGSVCPSVLQGRAGGRAVREGQGPNKE